MARMGLVVAEFNREITAVMEKEAVKEAEKAGATVSVLRVPGAYDTPIAVAKLLERKDIDCVAVLGAVIAGGTKHDGLVAYTAALQCSQLSVSYKKPVAFGIIGPGATWKQAEKRAREYAARAVASAVSLAKSLK